MSGELCIALAGNPNAGKTTIFNALTGTRQLVANYPGVTVEKVEGVFSFDGHDIRVVDLPGTYSLTALSDDELVARHYVLGEKPDLVVCVVDASNLERNLYLTVQFMELGVPLLVVFNKIDAARLRGLSVDVELLSRLLNVTIIETVAHEGRGLPELKKAIVKTVQAGPPRPATVTYGREVEAAIRELAPAISALDVTAREDPRWVAVKLLESDKEITDLLAGQGGEGQVLLDGAGKVIEEIEKHFGDRAEIVIADQRYGFISGACQEAVRTTVEERHSLSDRIDQVVTSPVFGIPLFLLLMYALFKLTFTLGAPVTEWIEALFHWVGNGVGALWPAGSDSALKSLVVDGLIGGVGGVLVFLPNIVFLFAAIAFLEDSGYMARGAFIVDRFMHKIGLHGRSFIPALIGFGCTVPAILATRALESRRDRLTTILVLPLISCGARFPIYALFTAAFFPVVWRPRIMMIVYLTGIALAALLAKLLRATIFKGDMSLFVMELPPYRMPTLRGILMHTWERSRLFLRKAATVIVVASMILWGLMNYPKPPAERVSGLTGSDRSAVELSTSVAGRIGHALEPAMKHVGFDWRTTTALLGAFAAKEIFVAQLGIVFSLGEQGSGSESLQKALRQAYTPLQAFCVMLFCLISVPCVATIAVTRAETGRWKWALLQLAGLTTLAYVVTLIVFQVGRFLGWG